MANEIAEIKKEADLAGRASYTLLFILSQIKNLSMEVRNERRKVCNLQGKTA
jgi:hypothetical protein